MRHVSEAVGQFAIQERPALYVEIDKLREENARLRDERDRYAAAIKETAAQFDEHLAHLQLLRARLLARV